MTKHTNDSHTADTLRCKRKRETPAEYCRSSNSLDSETESHVWSAFIMQGFVICLKSFLKCRYRRMSVSY